MKTNKFAIWWMAQPEWKLLYLPDAVILVGILLLVIFSGGTSIAGFIIGFVFGCMGAALYNIIGSAINLWCIGRF